MKTRLTVPIVLALMAAFALPSCSESESKIAMTDLPLAVQAAIKAQVGDVPIEKIERETEKGQVVYKVEAKRDGKKIELKVDSNGKLVAHD
jgi:uncharacterized membrane protein YkoI